MICEAPLAPASAPEMNPARAAISPLRWALDASAMARGTGQGRQRRADIRSRRDRRSRTGVCYREVMERSEQEDWARVVDDVIRGDQAAFLKLSRLITRFLTRWRAFDFSADWDDLVQEIVMSTIEATRKDKIRDPNAVYGYIRSATRFKFVDRIRKKHRQATDLESDGAPIDTVQNADQEVSEIRRDEVLDALERLPDKQRVALTHVYAEGMTYEEASDRTGIPLGSLKRYLRQGIAELDRLLSSQPSLSKPSVGSAG